MQLVFQNAVQCFGTAVRLVLLRVGIFELDAFIVCLQGELARDILTTSVEPDPSASSLRQFVTFDEPSYL